MIDAVVSEQERLGALDRYDVLDTPREESFDRITRLAKRVFDAPMVAISFIDGHRRWVKSQEGLGSAEITRRDAFCNYAIQQEQALIIPDALADARVAENLFVVGAPYIRFYAGMPLRTMDGHALGTLCVVDTRPREFDAEAVKTLSDFASLVIDALELRKAAMTDGLTGTLSRRAFRDEGNRAVALALRHQHDLSVLMIDLDHFKAVNDTHGHAMGDRVLAGTASTLMHALRDSDFIGRMGGEEFAVALPHAGRVTALEVAERLRSAVEKQRFDAPSGPLTVTTSIGVASLDRTIPHIDALLSRADAALYAAKGDGRNRCTEANFVEPAKRSVRKRVFKAGRISFNNRGSTIDCTVRNLSDTGAGLDVFTAQGVPKNFDLVVPSDSLARSCHVVWQTERHLDVTFEPV